MKRILLLLLLCIQVISFAQQITVLETSEVTALNGNESYYPKLNYDNSKLFFTTANFKGLYSLDLASGKTETITENPGAGYEFTFTDKNHVIYRINKFDESGLKRTQFLIDKNLEQNEEITLAEGKDLSTPQALNSDQLVYSVNGKISSSGNSSLSKNADALSVPAVFVENTKIVLWNNGTSKVLDPVEEGNYIWVSLSPDKTKILFTSAGKGTFISDLNGNILFELGYANAPKWSPDGNWILYMVDKDNGRQVTYSDIFITSFDGKNKYQLTKTENVFEMYPEWSQDMSIVVCHSDDGRIFMTKLKIEE